MASFGTLALLLMFGLLAGPDGGYAFADIRAAQPSAGRRRAVARSLRSIGAGSKAGLVPLHVWLPLAHPAAPSHVSALMSGVMTKVAVYGFVRIVFDLLGDAGLVVEHGGACARRHHRGDGRALRADAARPQAAARLPHGGEHRDHLHRARPCARIQGPRHGVGGGARAHRRPAARVQSFGLQEPPVLRRRRSAHRDRRARHGAPRRPHPSHAADRASSFLVGCAAISALPPLNGFVSGMADLPGDPAQPADCRPGGSSSWCRRSARCWRCRRRSPPPASSKRSA